jgi:hypothetical protein
MVSSPMCENGTSGQGFFNALDMSLAAMINLSAEENCGIGKLWGENSSVSTMRSLAVAEM